jgi:hypothetical protein
VSKLRESARGEHCTLEVAGVCGYDPSTVVLAHIRIPGTGVARKPHDLHGCYACSRCHDVLDRRVLSHEFEQNRWFYIARGIMRTHERMLENGAFY